MKRRVIVSLLWVARAWALDDVTSTRAMGMGEALRAAGSGAAAMYLNPAGMPTAEQYVAEAAYQSRPTDSTHIATVSVVDSITSPLAAGLYYTFATSEPEIAGQSVKTKTHEVGLGLALPIGKVLSLGVTPFKFNRQNGADSFSLDAGVVLRPIPGLSLGASGINLINDPPLLRKQLGLGAGYAFGEIFLLEFDTRLDLDRREEVSPRYGVGGELFLATAIALRAGAIHEAKEDATYVTAGVGYITGAAGVEAAMRQQVDAGDETLLSFSLKLFAE